jgi:protein-disulfide isomerase
MAQTRSGVNQFYVLLGVIALIGAGTLAWMVWKPKSVSIPIGGPVEVSDTSGFRGYLLGSDSAPVEVTEYADYQCPVCADFDRIQFPTVKRQLIETGQVRWRYRDFPLDQIHNHARVAAHAAACGDAQGKFWEMHRVIYDRHSEWALSTGDVTGKFHEFAIAAGVNPSEYDACMSSAKYAGRIEASFQEGQKLGVPSTPTFVIGQKMYPGAQSSDSIRAWVQALLPVSPPPIPTDKP